MRPFILFILGLALVACSRTHEVPRLTFEMKSFHQESKGGCVHDSIPCATFEANYPLFSPALDPTADLLNKKILRAIYGQDSSSSLKAKADVFIQEFEEGQKEGVPSGYNYSSVSEVLILSDTLISVRLTEDYFTGGAHGGSASSFINLDPKTAKKYTLADALKPGYEEGINKIGERFFRETRNLLPDEDLEEAGFDFAGGFRLNDNYGFRKEGIVFIFNSYEIGAYALGPTEFMIPYEEIRMWLK